MLQRFRSIFYRPVLKTKRSGELQESVPFEMMDKPRIKLVIVSLLEHNLSQRISHFRSFNSIRAKLTLTTVLVHLRLNLTQPYQTSGSLDFFIIAIALKFYLPPCVN